MARGRMRNSEIEMWARVGPEFIEDHKDCDCDSRRIHVPGRGSVPVNCEEYYTLLGVKPGDRRLKLEEMRA